MKLMKEMLKDERRAPKEYRMLRAKLKSPADRKVISGIIRQEQSHYRKLTKLNRRI